MSSGGLRDCFQLWNFSKVGRLMDSHAFVRDDMDRNESS